MFFLLLPGVHFRSKMNTDRIDEIDEDLEKLRKREKEQVRDFIERLVTAMLGGGLDDTCISKLYNDNHCEYPYLLYLRQKAKSSFSNHTI